MQEFSTKYGESMFRDIMGFIFNTKNENLENFSKLKAICDSKLKLQVSFLYFIVKNEKID